MILVSACLIGETCRYDGKSCTHELLKKLYDKGKTVAVCPEVLAGFPVPRLPCEIIGGNGADVLAGLAKAVTSAQDDISERMIAGCAAALELAKKNNIRLAVLKSKSAACGKDMIHDGTFTGRLVRGQGILTALLEKSGIRVISEEEFFMV